MPLALALIDVSRNINTPIRNIRYLCYILPPPNVNTMLVCVVYWSRVLPLPRPSEPCFYFASIRVHSRFGILSAFIRGWFLGLFAETRLNVRSAISGSIGPIPRTARQRRLYLIAPLVRPRTNCRETMMLNLVTGRAIME